MLIEREKVKDVIRGIRSGIGWVGDRDGSFCRFYEKIFL